MGFWRSLKSAFGKPVSAARKTAMSVSVPKDAKWILSYFVCHVGMYGVYREGLEKDHESDEIESAMQAYMTLVRTKAKLLSQDLVSQRLYMDWIGEEERERKFFDALDTVREFPRASGVAYGELELVKMYLVSYGRPSDIEKRLFEAEVSNRRELADLYRTFL